MRVLGEPGRLSPPIWPCTTRGFPCLVCCQTSGGLLPHLFTLAKLSERFEDVPQVFLRDATVLLSAGGIFSVALSVNGSTGFSLCSFLCRNASAHDASTSKPHRLKSVPPLPWRYQARCPISSPALASLRRRCPDFPPAQPSCNDQASDHPAHPPSLLYREKVVIRRLIRDEALGMLLPESLFARKANNEKAKEPQAPIPICGIHRSTELRH